MISLKKMTELVHHKAGLIIREGDSVIDATAGNGFDTVFLAEKVGFTGHVYAFDIQEEALARTAEILREKELQSRVTLIKADHKTLADHVRVPVSFIMYNLGYLPGGNRQITTKVHSTADSVKQALNMLKPGGMITIVLYPGHPEGRLEKEALLPICKNLSPSVYTVLHVMALNQANDPPELLVIQKILFCRNR